jgi:SAM-dependent methyltransferase
LTAALDGHAALPNLSERDLLTGKSLLHFAPERQLRERFRSVASHYVTADFDRGDCDLRLDISHMPEVADASFEALIVCDVLEHVPDDHAAFREIHRVLKPGGIAILSVPQKDSPATTDEDPTVTSEAERERRFGQKDHVRMYGDDFLERLISSGFEVQVLTSESLPREWISKHVLTPPIPSQNPLATNQRRIYFARKV